MNRLNLTIPVMIAATLGCSTFHGVSSLLQSGQVDHAAGGSLIQVQGEPLFLSGINIAWNFFARDFGNFAPDKEGGLDMNYFGATFATIAAAGGNTIRWWVHVSGEFNPSHDADGRYRCDDLAFLGELSRGLDLAHEHNLRVILTLWSFDMLDKAKNPNAFGDKVVDRNLQLLTKPDYFTYYLNNCYIPLITAIKEKPALLAIDVFNEPEGMSDVMDWQTTAKVPMQAIQSFVNVIAGTTHRLAPAVQVTVGAVGVDYLHYYTDDQLIAAGHDPQGTLDFYQAHYYGEGTDPLTTDAGTIVADKPLIIGELVSNKPTLTDTYKMLYQRGYAGVLAWKFKATPGDLKGSWADGMIAPALSCVAGGQPKTVIPKERAANYGQLVAQYSAQCPLGTDNIYPLCVNQASAKNNTNGWGWENNRSCRVSN